MKTLINANFRALRTGDYVKADISSGEFIFNSQSSEEDQLDKATLKEIAAKNKIAIGKKDNRNTIVEKLESGIKEMKLPTQDEQAASDQINEIVKAGFDNELDENDIVIQLIESKLVNLKSVYRVFNQAATDLGLRISTKARKEKVTEILMGEEFEPAEYSEVETMADRIVKEVPDTVTSQAISLIRRYCKDNELEFPKPAKRSAGGFRAKALSWMIANPEATKEELGEWVAEQEKDEKAADRLWTLFEFAKAVRAAE